MVIGTTGFDEAGKARIAELAQKTGVVFAPNMSVGVNVTLKLLEMAGAQFLSWLRYRNRGSASPS
jgi:4-hydroxy-tetrahydrodipicolinate reductase